MSASPPAPQAGITPAIDARGPIARHVPGLALVLAVSAAALAVSALEVRLFGHAMVEALVVAILIGMVVRTLWTPPAATAAGVRLAARELLEVAVFLLGVSVNLPLLLRAGPALAVGIVLLVVLGLALSYALGRALGLPHALAVLVACGNSICGNSAIAAVAPVIDADAEHVVSSIAFTAIIGVAMVLGLPLLMQPLGYSDYQYGVLAGLTVYAVPQVLAATFPVSALAGEVGTLVKLVRVLMLGPVVLFFALRHRAARAAGAAARPTARVRVTQLVPWFIVGFLALAALRSAGLVPDAAVGPARAVSGWLTVLAMAALGLGCDVRAIARAGRPVVATVVVSLAALVALSVALIRLLGIR
jgi:uncharacterized integral membrane protein (TIGR00698 family)